jgi:hypothetical protein
MTEMAVAEKTKIILVGGMDYNVPRELKEKFDIVKHIMQGSIYNTLPQAEYVFVITQWASHNIVDQVKREAKVPIVWLPHGWAGMKEALQKRSMIPPDAPEVSAATEPSPAPAVEHVATMGLSEAEIWKKFGEKMVEACRSLLKLGEKVTEKEMLEVMAMAGPPTEDCKLFLPKLQMLGVVVPTKKGLWRLASSDSEAYEEEPVPETEAAPTRERKRTGPIVRTEGETRLRLIPGNPSIVTRLIAGLRRGPYGTKKSIYVEMRRYQEFAGLTDNQVKLAVERAIEQKIVDDTHKDLFIQRQDDLILTLIQKVEVEEEPVVPKVLPQAETFTPFPTPPVTPPSGMSQDDAQKKWCFVVERVNQIRQRLGDILQHCRIEWMGSNNVLVICIPSALSSCQKFLESMENWGAISRTVQEHFTRDTVIRFMLDNGLRA